VGHTATRSRDGNPRVLILLENQTYLIDRRVGPEARSLTAAGYCVSVICPAVAGEPLKESVDGVIVRRYRPRRAKGGAVSQVAEYLTALVKTAWLMMKLARRPGFDAIQSCNPPDLFFLITWPFKLAGKRLLFDQHDLTPELYSSLYGRNTGLILSVLRWSERMSYRLSDAVLACNESYRRLAVTRGGVAPDRVFIVRNGPREGWPRALSPDPSLKNGRPLLVVYMGVMGYQDGVDVLLQVVNILVHRMGFREATFALVGDGDAVKDLKRQAHELGIEDFLDFPGWIRDEDTLSRYLVTADACVCPEPSSPLNDESTFIKVMEYMASATPVVAFDLPETKFSAGDAAAYAAPGDIRGFAERLEEVLTDPTLRTAMREEAVKRMPELRWERQIPNLLAAYERALGRPDERPAARPLEAPPEA
jgi:glycosyltransferase involved in cell wall biosynthesis